MLSFSIDDELHTLNLTLNNQNSPSSITSAGGLSALHSMTASWRDRRRRRNLVKFRFTDIPCCKRVDSSMHKSKKPFLPPDFRHSNEILKLIKVERTELVVCAHLSCRISNGNCFTSTTTTTPRD